MKNSIKVSSLLGLLDDLQLSTEELQKNRSLKMKRLVDKGYGPSAQQHLIEAVDHLLIFWDYVIKADPPPSSYLGENDEE